jgi:predicted metal-binding membrane protein
MVTLAWAALMTSDIARSDHGANRHTYLSLYGLGQWMLMSVAMMGPASLAAVRHVAGSSLSWRRNRAVGEFASSYLMVWTVFGGFVRVLQVKLDVMPSYTALAGALAIAAAWELSPVKQRSLKNCHRSIPLPPRGWAAERAALQFGLINGSACVGSCAALMLIMVVAPDAHLFWLMALTVLVASERMLERPLLSARRNAIALASASSITVVVAAIR